SNKMNPETNKAVSGINVQLNNIPQKTRCTDSIFANFCIFSRQKLPGLKCTARRQVESRKAKTGGLW
ncbi:MAG: hypothetical protein RR666_03965, partial [Raoultibacter sp.]